MFASTILSVLSLAMVAVAAPHYDEPTVGPSGNAVCGNGQVVSCCNSKGSDNADGLIGISNLLGGNCEQLNIPIIAVNVPISQACAGNQAACCTAGEEGLLNVSCNPVGV